MEIRSFGRYKENTFKTPRPKQKRATKKKESQISLFTCRLDLQNLNACGLGLLCRLILENLIFERLSPKNPTSHIIV